MIKYTITEEAKNSPRLTVSPITGELIGIGGEVVVNRPPPHCPTTCREATDKEYLEIAKNGGIIGLVIADEKYIEEQPKDDYTCSTNTKKKV